MKHGASVFYPGGACSGGEVKKKVKGEDKAAPQQQPKQRWSVDEDKITKWKLGQTGQPLVDANMREMLLTGKASANAF